MSFSKFHIADLIFRQTKNNLSKTESEQLEQWIDQSEANRTLFEKLRHKDSYKSKTELYRQFKKLQQYSHVQFAIKQQKKKELFWSISAAAIFLLLVSTTFVIALQKNNANEEAPVLITQKELIKPGRATATLETSGGEILDLSSQSTSIASQGGANINHQNNTLQYETGENANRETEEVYNTLSVPRGGEYKLILSDGTGVWLNAESSIRYPAQFLKSTREVYVSGEVYFEVAHDEKRPFIVTTKNTQVKVLGTAFNLRSYQDEQVIQTTLVRGAVSVGTGNTRQTIITPSEQYTYNESTGESAVRKVDTSIYTSWKDGIFIFNSQPLEHILNDISRWYNVRFEFLDAALKSYVFSGRVKKYENANSLLSIFEDTGGILFEKQGEVIYIKKKK